MNLSQRATEVKDSITLKLNAKAVQLAAAGTKIYNLTAGQLPYRPPADFVDHIQNGLNFLKSFQYSPAAGDPELKTKFMADHGKHRDLNFSDYGMSCIISNGAKHSLSLALGTIIEPRDEVICLAPYWLTYPEQIKLWGGHPRTVRTRIFDAFVPAISDVEEILNHNTKAIILNSPNNPAGFHYSEEWMQEFAALIKKYPKVWILSDEIYYHLTYYDPKPKYFYQYDNDLLSRTIIIDGISKSLGATGLRVGYTIAPNEMVQAMGKLQAQTTSGANSLMQKALINFDFEKRDEYLTPINKHLRANSERLREAFRTSEMAQLWYQTKSAFYYILDFSQTPCFKKWKAKYPLQSDVAFEICEDLLLNTGIALVPTSDFGVENAARISLVNEKEVFQEALEILIKYLKKED